MDTDYYPDSSRDSITDQLDVVVRLMDACAALHYASSFPGLKPNVHGYSLGKKYARVWYDMSNGQRMVAFFVQLDNGDVWKAAGWKAPALNFVRGNITTRAGRWALTGGKLGPEGHYYGGL